MKFFSSPTLVSGDSGLGGRAQAPKAADVAKIDPTAFMQIPDPIRVLVIGGPNVGKTAIIRRFAKNFFVAAATPTIGCDLVFVNTAQNKPSKQFSDQSQSSAQHTALLLDLSHAELKSSHLANYLCSSIHNLVGVEAIVLVISAVDAKSLAVAEQWALTLQDILPEHQLHPIPTLIAKNKIDLVTSKNEVCSHETLNRYCAANGFMGWRQCSAQSGEGVVEMMNEIIQVVVRCRDHTRRVQQQRSALSPSLPEFTVVPISATFTTHALWAATSSTAPQATTEQDPTAN